MKARGIMDIIATIETLNKKAGEINQKRERLLGQVQTLESQLNVKLAEYNKKRNLNLTIDQIEDEYNKVRAECIRQVEETSELIKKIESGDFVEKKVALPEEEESTILSDDLDISVDEAPQDVISEDTEEIATSETIEPHEEIIIDDVKEVSTSDVMFEVDEDEDDDDDDIEFLFDDIKNVLEGGK